MANPPTKIQSAAGGNTIVTSRTYPTNLVGWSTPSVGNLVIVTLCKASTGVITGPGGQWALCAQYGDNPNIEVWAKIIDGTETTAAWTFTTSTCGFDAREYSAGAGAIWTFDTGRVNGALTAAGTSLSSGLAGVLTTSSEILITAVAASNVISAEAVVGGPSWSTPLTSTISASSDAIVAVSDSVSGDWSWTTSRKARAAIAAFYAKYPRSMASIGGLSTVPSTVPLAVAGAIG